MFNKCKVCESKVHEENRKLSLVKCNKCSLVFCKKKYSDLEIISTYDKLYNTTNQYRRVTPASEKFFYKYTPTR